MIDPDTKQLHGHTPHKAIWLIIGICGLSALGWLINGFDPDSTLITGSFFFILFVTIFGFTYFATNIVRRSILAGSGVFGFFFLRYLGLREIYYLLLLAACLISLELYFQKR